MAFPGLRRRTIDPFLFAIIATAGLASVFPCRGEAAIVLGRATTVAIGALFFLYGARLSPIAVWHGMSNWRLQLLVLASTFGVFPLLGLAVRMLVPDILSPALYPGVLLLSVLPSTVQSSIAFTAMAGGNLAAAVCAASVSSLIGVIATPGLVALLMRGTGGASLSGVGDILLQILAPFVLGQFARRWIIPWLEGRTWLTTLVDRGSIPLIVYSAFSEAMVSGIWSRVDLSSLGGLLLADGGLLAAVLTLTTALSRWLGFSRRDEIAIVFCGSKKSLAAGASLLNILFPAGTAGLAMLPLILFHQLQLMVCAMLARRYARSGRADQVARPAARVSGAGMDEQAKRPPHLRARHRVAGARRRHHGVRFRTR